MILEIKYKKLTSILCIFLLIYIILIFSAEKIETIFTFPASHFRDIEFYPYNDVGIQTEEINIKSSLGNNINGVYVGDGKGKTVYYFHGNGGPLNMFYSDIKYIHSLGYNVMAYDYPGYGKSEGMSYKKDIGNFSKEFYDYIKKEKGLKNNQIIIWGYSVGAAVAVDFAEKYNFEKMVLVSPFTSRYDMAADIIGFPIQKFLFLKNSFNNTELVKKLNKPALIIHGNSDELINFNQGKSVFDNYGNFFIKEGLGSKVNKYFIEIDGMGHNGIINEYGEILRYKIGDFLDSGKLDFNKMLLDEKQIEKLKKDNKINSYNLDFDSSLTKFVNNKISFTELSYTPNDLEDISSKYVLDTKGNGQLRRTANTFLQRLAKDFFEEFSRQLTVVSSYRSYNYQAGIKSRGCPDNLCAKAGFSEHQSGLAVDIFAASTQKEWETNYMYREYYNWFKVNAHKYGFHNTYQKGLEIDGYEIEPWHWRYLGVELSTYLKNNNITFAEFYNK